MRSFGSDNHSGVHPELMTALAKANLDHAPSYGTDQWSERAQEIFKKEFGPQAQVFFVFNGTAANVTALQALVRPFESILCSDLSHLNVDECGAPEFFTGAKLCPLPSNNGKISLADAKEALIRRGDQHFSQRKVLSLTQPTEMGTCYSLEELREFCNWAHQEGLWVHVDGARLSNAVHFLKTSFREMIAQTGVDVVSFGGTKNGFMMGEAVVFLNENLAQNFKYIRKQSAQLPSKTRFIAAQFETYLGTDLWKKISEHSHSMALLLRHLMSELPGIEITAPTESNAVFAKLPRSWIKPLREKYFFYVWNEKTFECRLMTSWDTRPEEIYEFVALMKELL